MSTTGNLWRKIHGAITKKPTNFSWVVGDLLAGSGMPTSRGEMAWVKAKGIKAVLTLTEEPLPESWLRDMDYLHIPTINRTAASLQSIDRAVNFVGEHVKAKRPVMVHCAAGKGRTGTVLAAYMVKFRGMDARSAIEAVRNMRPGSVENGQQEEALERYQKYLKGM